MKAVEVSIAFAPITDQTITFDYDAPFDKNGILKRLLKHKETFVIYLKTGWPENGIPERIMRSGVSASWFIALDCFAVQQYPASILFAIISIESLLNRDSRMYEFREGGTTWLNLSFALNKAREIGIDISDLQDENGTFETILNRRNKIAHGDVPGYIDFLNRKESVEELIHKNLSEEELSAKITEKVAITETQALDQIQRTFNFIKKWAQSKPIFIMEDAD